MIMNYRIEYHDENGSTIHEDQCGTFISNEKEGIEWINSKNLEYSDRHFIVESFVSRSFLKEPMLSIADWN